MSTGEIMFIPLGGGDNIGASCYYLKLGKNNILLDCGKGFDGSKISFSPNFYTLLKFIVSYDCISGLPPNFARHTFARAFGSCRSIAGIFERS